MHNYTRLSYFPIAMGGSMHICFKGDPTAQAAEQSQATFDNQLMSLMTAQYGKQSAITTYLTNQMTPQINQGGVGIGGAALAAMRTNAADTTTTQFQNERKAAASLGSQSGLPSGVNAQLSAEALNQEALAQSQAQNQITGLNEQTKQANYWNAISTLNGQAATENPLGYANAATSGSGAVAGLSQAVTAANQSQLLGALGGIAGGIGTAVGGYFGKK